MVAQAVESKREKNSSGMASIKVSQELWNQIEEAKDEARRQTGKRPSSDEIISGLFVAASAQTAPLGKARPGYKIVEVHEDVVAVLGELSKAILRGKK